MATTAWLVGAYQAIPAAAFDVNAASKTIATGDYYLRHGTSTISAMAQLEAKIQEEEASASVFFAKSGKVRITNTGTWSLTWGADTTWRDFFGFAGDLSGSANYTAANLSPFFWSPGITESPMKSPLGTSGAFTTDGRYVEGPDQVDVTFHNTWREQMFRFPFVALAKYHTSSEAGGEFISFWQNVLMRGRNWQLYRSIDEDTTDDTTAATLGSVLGPYVMRLPRNSHENPFSRREGLEWVDHSATIDIECRTVNELSNS